MRTFYLWAATILFIGPTTAQSRVVSVCDALSKRTEFNGKTISVRGVVAGSEEGAWLVARDCSYKLVEKGIEWRLIISLEYPESSTHESGGRIASKVDWEAMRKADAKIREMKPDREKDLVMATYVGTFRTYGDLGKRADPSGRNPMRFGLGILALRGLAALDLEFLYWSLGVQWANPVPGRSPHR
jgi:hypothetical protein